MLQRHESSRRNRFGWQAGRRLRQPSRWNFWIQVLGGGGLLMALQFGNPRMVLPWISHHLGVAYILVVMLVPLYQAGLVFSQLTAAPLVTRLALRKRLVAGIGLFLACLFALIFAVAETLSPAIAAIALLACATTFGMTLGIFNVGNMDLLSKTVPPRVRGKVLARRAALGGALTLIGTFAIWILVPRVDSNHLMLLWFAVFAWIGAAAAYAAVLEAPSEPARAGEASLSLQHAREIMAHHPWFPRLMGTGILLQSVEMAIPFYAVHAASLHDPSAHNLSAFVVAVALGFLLSGPIWGRLNDRNTRLTLTLSCSLAACAGICVLVFDQLGDPGLPYYHAMVFVPLALARQGSAQARARRLSVKAPTGERPAMASYNSAAVAFGGVCAGLLLGTAGHLHDIRTPLVMLIVASIVAALVGHWTFADQNARDQRATRRSLWNSEIRKPPPTAIVKSSR
ncbi:MAG: MFS transporter [Pseudomonadota bacterium]